MQKKRYNAEEIIHKLRGADVLLGQGKTVNRVCKQIGVIDQTYYRWRITYDGMKVRPVNGFFETYYGTELTPNHFEHGPISGVSMWTSSAPESPSTMPTSSRSKVTSGMSV